MVQDQIIRDPGPSGGGGGLGLRQEAGLAEQLSPSGEEGDEYLGIGKTFKGLTDEEFTWMTGRLQELKDYETDYTVHVHPSLVVEVAFNEIQRSPHYRSGYALRFARVTRIRTDKGPGDADTLARVRELYERQFRYKDRIDL